MREAYQCCRSPRGRQAEGRDRHSQKPETRSGVEFDDARHHLREQERQIADADDDEAR
jgi:hypothetical protein